MPLTDLSGSTKINFRACLASAQEVCASVSDLSKRQPLSEAIGSAVIWHEGYNIFILSEFDLRDYSAALC